MTGHEHGDPILDGDAENLTAIAAGELQDVADGVYEELRRRYTLGSGEAEKLNAGVVAAVDVFARGTVKPIVADDTVLIGIRTGELHGMTRACDREGVAMIAVGVYGPFALNATEAAIAGEVVVKANQIVLAELIDTDGNNQPGAISRDGAVGGVENNEQGEDQ
jgi:hypothetical protein